MTLLPRIVVFIFALDPTTTTLLLPLDHCPSYKILQLALYSTATSYDVHVRIAASASVRSFTRLVQQRLVFSTMHRAIQGNTDEDLH